ncbi:MAG TPA: hypothetical protein VME47_14145 [Acetobacteraceae bacterium]|nr:hypothetical protein [Acetobacteraceae bacterium]
MNQGLDISLAPERLDEGLPEERAGFGQFIVRAGSVALTEGFDGFVDALRPGPLVSGYHAAEWFAWNWWRILYEPYSPRSPDWWRAHTMTAIGEGYVWPNITFRTDGVRAAVIARPSSDPDARPFRYISSNMWLGSTEQMREAINAFLTRVVHRLTEKGINSSNLQHILAELVQERLDPAMMEQRRLEALMGREPDEADDAIIALMEDAKELGMHGVEELAADAAGRSIPRASTLHNIARTEGVEVLPDDAVRLSTTDVAETKKQEVAWRQGRHLAEVLRRKLGLGAAPVATTRLAEMLGTLAPDPHKSYGMAPLSFVLREKDGTARLVLRSKWETGRRFELARLLGDWLLFGASAPIMPATRAYTFRQKAQRSFAAEFLCPFGATEDMLHGDYSSEAIEEVSEHFDVSTLTVETLLRNHGRIEREPLADAA